MSDEMPEGAHRFYAEFEGLDWFEIPGHPDALFLAQPEAQLAAVPFGGLSEGWEERGCITDTPLAFTREPIKSIDDQRWVVLSAQIPDRLTL